MKIINKLMLLIMLLTICTVPAHAEEEIKVMVNGEYIETVQPPINIEGRVLVPVREICEALDCTVEWDNGTIYVRNQIMRVDMGINSYYIIKHIDGREKEIKLDVPPILYNEKTLLPVRALSEAFGAEVQWIDEEKCVVVESTVYYSEYGIDEYYIAKNKDKVGMVDATGNSVLPIEYDSISYFLFDLTKNYVEVEKDGYVAIFKLSDRKFIADFEYTNAEYRREGMLELRKDKYWGVIDEEGNVCIDFLYDTIYPSSDGYYAVKKNGQYGVIDKEENEIIKFGKYDKISCVNYGEDSLPGYVITKNGKTGLIDANENILIPAEYDRVWTYNAYIGVEKASLSGVLNIKGEEIIPIEYDRMINEYGYLLVEKDSLWGVINLECEEIIPVQYGLIVAMSKDRFRVEKADGKWCIANENGEFLTDFIYDQILDHDDIIVVERDYLFGCIDKDGNILIPMEYDYIEAYNGYVVVEKEEKFGVLTMKGEALIPIEYDDIYIRDDGYIAAEKDGERIFFNSDGSRK